MISFSDQYDDDGLAELKNVHESPSLNVNEKIETVNGEGLWWLSG